MSFFTIAPEDTRVRWYRIREVQGEYAPHVYVDEYPVEKETPCGVWLDLGWGARRFVLHGARKRWACPTREEAKESFIARKQKHLRILRAQVECVERALEQVMCI